MLSQELELEAVAKAAPLVEEVLVALEALLHSRHLPLVELLVSGDHSLLPHHEFALLPEERPPPSCSVLIEDAMRGDAQTHPSRDVLRTQGLGAFWAEAQVSTAAEAWLGERTVVKSLLRETVARTPSARLLEQTHLVQPCHVSDPRHQLSDLRVDAHTESTAQQVSSAVLSPLFDLLSADLLSAKV